MIISSENIAALLRREHDSDPLVITPAPDLDELEKSGSASVDLRLGTWFVRPRQRSVPILDILGAKEPTDPRITKTHYVPFGQRFILHPRTFVLASTLEWIRLPSNLSAYVIGRSSWGRRGLVIATATGVHPQFSGCLTLELANVGELPIAVRPGMAVCQLFLHETTGTATYQDKSAFIGFRRPILGTIKPDRMAERLGRSQS